MQPEDALTVLFRHNQWANELLIGRCAALSDEQLETGIVGAYGTIRETLQHLVASERSYISRISTGRPHRTPEGARLTLAEIAELARASGAALVEWAAKVQPGDTVEVDWDGTPRDVPKSVLLTQAINHATEHRAQIMATMTQLGVEPPELDGWQFFDAQSG